jgi:hypothetical protein
MKRIPINLLFIVLSMLGLSACSTNTVKPVGSPTSAGATASQLPTVFPPTYTTTATPLVTKTVQSTPSASATQTLTVTPASGTPQFSTTGDSAAFVSDVTVPDGTIFKPGDTFTKTWRLSNNGSTTWTTSYTLVYIRGNLMGSVQAIQLPVEVPSGKTVDLSVSFTAPAAAGQFTSLWMLKNGSGQLFGIGPNANQPFYVLINVSSSIPGTAIQTTTTPASTTPGSMTATAATLSVDQTTYSGACPVTINLSGTITSSGIGTLVYGLEAGSSTPGFTFTLPGAQTEVYTSGGSHSLPVSYFLNISSSVSGWVRLFISVPNTLRSTQVDFTITCK